ncbi:NUDIX hydrolase [Candidatus Peregrinibacteria bacterium]|nr:NUDIX hydrolase [Candidatus Peregrinibacteria bacterium]
MKTTIKIGVIAMNKKNQVLLIKEKYREVDGFKWNFIKGTYDRVEETLAECAKRELKEEAGLNVKIDNFQLKGVHNYGSAKDPKVLFIFYVFNICDEGSLSLLKDQKSRGENIIRLNWFSLEEAFKLKQNDFVAEYVYFSLKTLKNYLRKSNVDEIMFSTESRIV